MRSANELTLVYVDAEIVSNSSSESFKMCFNEFVLLIFIFDEYVSVTLFGNHCL